MGLRTRLGDEAELCSQPTISRLENLPDTRALLRMGQAMVDLYCASFRQVPRGVKRKMSGYPLRPRTPQPTTRIDFSAAIRIAK